MASNNGEQAACPHAVPIYTRLDQGEKKFERLEIKLDQNSKDTAEILDILNLGRSFFRILGIIGNVIKWAAGIGAAVAGLWFAMKNGRAP